MFGSPLFDATAALLAGALYYLWPAIQAWLAGDGSERPAAPTPFMLPVAAPKRSPPDMVITMDLPFSPADRFDALHTLAIYYRSIKLPEAEIEQLLAPHLKHLLTP